MKYKSRLHHACTCISWMTLQGLILWIRHQKLNPCRRQNSSAFSNYWWFSCKYLFFLCTHFLFSLFFHFFGRYLYPIGSINFYFRSRKSQNWVVDRTYRPFCIWKQVFFWVNNKYFLSQINNWRTIRSYVYEFIQNTCCKIGF